MKNYITGETLTYDIQNTGEDVETYSFGYLENGRLVINGNNLKVIAKSGQADNLIVLGDNNHIETGDGDDFVRIGTVVAGMESYNRVSNNNTVLTGEGNDHVTVYGQDNTITLGKGDDSLFSVYDLSMNTISGNTALYTYVHENNIANSQDGRIEMFSQGSEGGDCRLLALLENLSKNPSFTSLYEYVNIQSRGGSYNVVFKNYDTQGGKQNAITVTADEINNWGNVHGDLDVVIVDIAMNKLININHDYGMNSVVNAYYNTIGDYMFGRNLITAVGYNPLVLDTLWELYQDGEINNLEIGLSGEPNDAIGYIPGHQYSVLDVQENYVTLVNPWNNMDRVTFSHDALAGNGLYIYGEDIFNQGRILPNADGDVLLSNVSVDDILSQIESWKSSNSASGMADIASADTNDVAAIAYAGVTGSEVDVIEQYVA